MYLWIVPLLAAAVIVVRSIEVPVPCNGTHTMIPGETVVFMGGNGTISYLTPHVCQYDLVNVDGYTLQMECIDVTMDINSVATCAANTFTTNGVAFGCPFNSTLYMRFTTQPLMSVKVTSLTATGSYRCTAYLLKKAECCGNTRTDGQYRHLAHLVPVQSPDCGATIISDRAAITLATCVTNIKATTLLEVGYQTASVATYAIYIAIANPNYDPITGNSNLGVVITVSAILFNLDVGPACIFINQTVPAFPALTAVQQVRASDLRMETVSLNLNGANCLTRKRICTDSTVTPGCGFLQGSGIIFADKTGQAYLEGVYSGLNCTGMYTGESQDFAQGPAEIALTLIPATTICQRKFVVA